MAASARSVRRKLKNVVNQFSDVQALTREATSNDPWGPSTTILIQLADLTQSPVNRRDMFDILWKRMNDSERNWRHVYKSLLCWEYLLKVGHEHVFDECRTNIKFFELLREFTSLDVTTGTDNGTKVRKLAEEVIHLIRDTEYYAIERSKAIELANKFRSTSDARNSFSGPLTSRSQNASKRFTDDLELSRVNRESISHSRSFQQLAPASQIEEERQIQIALELSKLEADKERALREYEEKASQQAEATAIAESLREHEEQMNTISLIPDLESWPSKPPSYDQLSSTKPLALTAPPQASNNPWEVPAPASSNNGWPPAAATSAPPTIDPFAIKPAAPVTHQGFYAPFAGPSNNGLSATNGTNPFMSNFGQAAPRMMASTNPFGAPSQPPLQQQQQPMSIGFNAFAPNFNSQMQMPMFGNHPQQQQQPVAPAANPFQAFPGVPPVQNTPTPAPALALPPAKPTSVDDLLF